MKEVAYEIEFESEETFGAYNDAVKWCRENGYSVGSMERDLPVGIMKGDVLISKWTNMNIVDHETLDGRIIGNDKRNGLITVQIMEEN